MKRSLVVSTFLLALVVSLAGNLPLPGIANQAATPDAGNRHPIVGTWQWDNNPGTAGAGASFAVFNAGGTYIEFYPPVGVGIGAWQATGARTVNLTIVFQDIDDDPDVAEPGTSTYRIAAEVDATGNEITATGDLEVRDATGASVRIEPFTGRATRVVAEAPGVATTPVATPAA